MKTCLPFLSLGLTLAVMPAAGVGAADVFVSPVGQDINPGTADKPFATLERARDAVRQLRVADAKRVGGITIWLRAGDYLRTAALELSATDSGTAEAPVAVLRLEGQGRSRSESIPVARRGRANG